MLIAAYLIINGCAEPDKATVSFSISEEIESHPF